MFRFATEIDPDAYREAIRAVTFLVVGFAGGVITHPFGSGWWASGRE